MIEDLSREKILSIFPNLTNAELDELLWFLPSPNTVNISDENKPKKKRLPKKIKAK